VGAEVGLRARVVAIDGDAAAHLFGRIVEAVIPRRHGADDAEGLAVERVDLQRRVDRFLVFRVPAFDVVDGSGQRVGFEAVRVDRDRLGDLRPRVVFFVLLNGELGEKQMHADVGGIQLQRAAGVLFRGGRILVDERTRHARHGRRVIRRRLEGDLE
jgi:hypothetical protein